MWTTTEPGVGLAVEPRAITPVMLFGVNELAGGDAAGAIGIWPCVGTGGRVMALGVWASAAPSQPTAPSVATLAASSLRMSGPFRSAWRLACYQPWIAVVVSCGSDQNSLASPRPTVATNRFRSSQHDSHLGRHRRDAADIRWWDRRVQAAKTAPRGAFGGQVEGYDRIGHGACHAAAGAGAGHCRRLGVCL